MTYSNRLNSPNQYYNFSASHTALNMPVPKNTPQKRFAPLTSKDVFASHTATACLPGLFISHGTPTLAIEKSAATNALARIGQNLPKPKAILIMSAHWVSNSLEISSHANPQTWHDFSGFDPKLRHISYPANGHPELAEALSSQLNRMGVLNSLNPIRPFDHGVWAPLLHLYPQADVPVIQLSLPKYFDAYACYQLGNLCRQLRHEQIMVIGSGNITHNLANLQWDAQSEDKLAKSFKIWLLNHLKRDIPSALEWRQFANIEKVHPTDEHLLPLFFALGSGQRVSSVHESMVHHSLGMDIYRFD